MATNAEDWPHSMDHSSSHDSHENGPSQDHAVSPPIDLDMSAWTPRFLDEVKNDPTGCGAEGITQGMAYATIPEDRVPQRTVEMQLEQDTDMPHVSSPNHFKPSWDDEAWRFPPSPEPPSEKNETQMEETNETARMCHRRDSQIQTNRDLFTHSEAHHRSPPSKLPGGSANNGNIYTWHGYGRRSPQSPVQTYGSVSYRTNKGPESGEGNDMSEGLPSLAVEDEPITIQSDNETCTAPSNTRLSPTTPPIPQPTVNGSHRQSHDNNYLTRNTSALDNERHHTGHDSHRKSHPRADIPVDSLPNIAVPTSDTDASWTEADDKQQWYYALQDALSSFRKDGGRLSVVIGPLNTAQRRKVHAMAHIMSLSHVSLRHANAKNGDTVEGDDGDKKSHKKHTVLSKCRILPASDERTSSRIWNPTGESWLRGSLDARIVEVENVPADMDPPIFQRFLRDKDLPVAQRVAVDPVTGAVGCLFYRDPLDAALAMLELNNALPTALTTHGRLKCDYLHFPQDFGSGHDPEDHFQDLVSEVWEWKDCEKAKRQSPEDPHPVTRWPSVYPRTSEAANLDRIGNRRGAGGNYQQDGSGSSGHSQPTSGSENTDSGNNSGASHPEHSGSSSDIGFGSGSGPDQPSATSSNRKRAIPGGFPCDWAGCDKIFNRRADANKHRKRTHERPFPCRSCEKGFGDKKDLRRHWERMHRGEAGGPGSREGDSTD